MAFNFGGLGSAPAPAAGGFSFGASTTGAPVSFGAAPASATPAAAAAAPATPAAPAFGFGSAPAASAVTPAPAAPAAPTFSFGAAPVAAATVPPAPAQAPAAFSFGAAPAASKPLAAAATAPVSFGAPAIEKPPLFGAQSPAPAKRPATGGRDEGDAPAFGGFGSTEASTSKATPAFNFSAVPAAANKEATRSTKSKTSETTPAAPVFGGFGTTSSDTNSKPVPTTGTTANTTPTAASATATGGGFSFGATPTTKTTAPSTPSVTPGAPAPVSTPATTTKPTIANPTATPSTTTVTPAPNMEPPVLAYQTLTVEEILNKFQRQIEEDSLAFIEEAKRVCDYDAVLRDSQRDLANLTTEAQRLMIEQDQIENGLNTIGAFQNQLDTILTGVEDQIGSIFQAQNHLNPVDADIERERAYETAKMIEYQLDDVTNSLRDTFDTLNQASASAFGAGGNSTDTSGGDINGINSAYDVITILNRHQDGLAQLEATAQKLELDCNEVTAVLQTSRR